MLLLNPRIHGLLDYIAVLVYFLGPSMLGFTTTAATIFYTLGVIHLLLTLSTSFPLGVFKVIPFTVHGWIEFILSLVLIALPWMGGFASELVARNFYVGYGIIFFIVWLVTDYAGAEAPGGWFAHHGFAR